jgi:Na+/melibiose symporter-like transporter
MLCVTIFIFITLAMKGGSYVYYFENYVDKIKLNEFLTSIKKFLPAFENDTALGLGVFNGGGILVGLIGIMLSKPLADKFGKRNVFMLSLFISTLFIILFYFYPPKSIGIIFGSQMLHGFFYGISTPVLWAMIADVADFSEWKNNRRATAIIFSAMMVGLKAGLSIGNAIIVWVLGMYHYVPKSATPQAESAVHATKLLVSIFPAIPFLLAVALLFFYEINKTKEVQIENDLKRRRVMNDEL